MIFYSHIKVPAHLDAVDKAVHFITDRAAAFGFDSERIKDIELASEEAIVNIVNYAYPEHKGEIEIHCQGDDADQFIIKTIDRGTPFDIRKLPPPELPSDISNCRVGGLGIYLIKMMAHTIKYERKDERNILSITFIKNKKNDPGTNKFT